MQNERCIMDDGMANVAIFLIFIESVIFCYLYMMHFLARYGTYGHSGTWDECHPNPKYSLVTDYKHLLYQSDDLTFYTL
jgi:hypothetical protein